MRRTKIIATIGPASRNREVIRGLAEAGMDVARLNFSHGTHDEHRETFKLICGVAEETGRNIAVLADLQGPKIRTGLLAGGTPVALKEGSSFCITTRTVPGDDQCVSTTYQALPHDVRPGDHILLADGAFELVVERVSDSDVHCRVVRGGLLGQHKGINLPGVTVSAAALTDKDLEDLHFALDLGVDYVALSFVRSAEDVHRLRREIETSGRDVRMVAKIERPEAVAQFDAILSATDAVMVARGDLGVEVSLDDVPQIQKTLIAKCNVAGVPVITATQMLESMIENSRPTRAEVADVANAIYDGTDAVMLSGETATGRFPVEAVRVMAAVTNKADVACVNAPLNKTSAHTTNLTYGEAIGEAVRRMCEVLYVRHIVCFTQSGYTAGAIARYRPGAPIVALTMTAEARRRCALYWGVQAIQVEEASSVDRMVIQVDQMLVERSLAAPGDTIIIVAGTPLAVAGRTNLLKLHTVGEAT